VLVLVLACTPAFLLLTLAVYVAMHCQVKWWLRLCCV